MTIISGAHNIRDISDTAYPEPLLAQNMLLRGEALCFLPEQGMHDLYSLGIRTVIDLRNNNEILTQGHGPAQAYYDSNRITYLHVDMNPTAEFRKSAHGQDPYHHLAEAYLSLLDNGGTELCSALNHALSQTGGTYIHCAIGKDRTGAVAAVIASALGIPRDRIIHDYLASTPATRHFISLLAGDPNYPEFTDPDLTAILPNADTIATVLTALEQPDTANTSAPRTTRSWLVSKGLHKATFTNAFMLPEIVTPNTATHTPSRSSRFGDRRLAARDGD